MHPGLEVKGLKTTIVVTSRQKANVEYIYQLTIMIMDYFKFINRILHLYFMNYCLKVI